MEMTCDCREVNGAPPQEIFVTQVDSGTLEAQIDATKMVDDQAEKRKNLSLTKVSASSDSGEKEV